MAAASYCMGLTDCFSYITHSIGIAMPLSIPRFTWYAVSPELEVGDDDEGPKIVPKIKIRAIGSKISL
ncbi:hypothetical protein D3C85_1534920 [compost metagenome]